MFSANFIGGPIVNDPENANAIDALQRRLTNNANVIPFIGAGLSCPFGYPDWAEFLREGAERVDKKNEVEDHIRIGDYEAAMSVIHRELTGINYFDFLRDTFGGRKAGAATWNAAARFLPAMPKTPIVTTNIDGAVEQVFKEHGSSLEVVVGPRRDRIRVAIEEMIPCLIKLHGDYRDESDRILTLEDYERHYGSDMRNSRKQQPFLGVVQNLLAGNSFLFLGFGMEERTEKLLQFVAERGGLHSHWIVLPRSSRRTYRERAKELGRSNVRTLWYDESHHEHIGAFLHWCTYTVAPAESPLRRFYSAIAEGKYSAALAFGEEAISNGFEDPALTWNISVTTELAARELLDQGKIEEGMQLLRKRIASHERETQSAEELQWALSYALRMTGSANVPVEVNASTLEILSIIREALANPEPTLLSHNYQRASASGVADVLKILYLLSQTAQCNGNEIEVISKDSFANAAWQAINSQREFSVQAAKVQGHFRIAKMLYYQAQAEWQGGRSEKAKLAFVGRRVAALDDLRAQATWYDQR
jgi:SIR2-like domain